MTVVTLRNLRTYYPIYGDDLVIQTPEGAEFSANPADYWQVKDPDAVVVYGGAFLAVRVRTTVPVECAEQTFRSIQEALEEGVDFAEYE